MAADSDTELLEFPKVAVLLATYNGARWLTEQIDSINAQIGVDLRVIASDDASTDATPQILNAISALDKRWSVMPTKKNSGSSNANFMRLISESDIGDAQFIAFSDQDDIWFAHKMQRALEVLQSSSAHGYTSNVIAIYDDGRQKSLNKAYPQRQYDHFFESPGPGCTMVLCRSLFEQFRLFFFKNTDACTTFSHHDWLIYAFTRCYGMTWVIDAQPSMYYRQHNGNVVGVNMGVNAFASRIKMIRSGWYKNQILNLCTLLQNTPLEQKLVIDIMFWLNSRPNLHGRAKFISQVSSNARRLPRDRGVLMLMAATGVLWGDG